MSLRIPEMPEGVDTLTAALAYAAAGFYVLPVRRGTKHPGSMVGDGWHSKSSRDPKQITAWFAGADHGIALHCGRSGAVVFDVDDPSALPDVLFRNLNGAPHQSSRPDVPARGHYVFAMPEGRLLGNSGGKLGGDWGEVRGANGVIIVAPSQHAEGGEYRWVRVGEVPTLPAEIDEQLPESSPAEDAATDAVVAKFIQQCQASRRPNVLHGMTAALRKRLEAKESRHQSLVSVLAGAMKEARAGLYTAQAAIDAVKPMFLAEVTKPPASAKQGLPRSPAAAAAEFNGVLAWAVGQALAADLDEVKTRVDGKMPDNVEWVDRIAATDTTDTTQTDKPGAGRRASVEWAANIRPRRQVWLWQDRVPVGTVSGLAGRGGCGKTTYAIHQAAQLSRGTLPGQYFGQPRPTLIWSGEDAWSTVLVPRAIAAGADMNLIGRLAIESDTDGATSEVTPRLPLDVGAFRDAITSTGAVLVIIDPIASTMSGDLHREADVRDAVDALARLAEATGAVVMFVRHFGKGGGNASDKMSGSHAFRDAVRSVFLFAADEEEPGRVIVTQDKGNYAPPGEESFAFRLENTVVSTDDGDAEVASVVDLGASDISVGDVINRVAPRDEEFDERDYTADFKESWLYKYLAAASKAKAEVRPKDAVAVGADQGISRRSVFRLFESLANAGMAQSIEGDGFPRVTYWQLIDGTTGEHSEGGGTTGTTGAELQKRSGTTGDSSEPVALQGGTTGENSPELYECTGAEPPDSSVVPVVPPNLANAGDAAPPGGLTSGTPGQTDRVQQILARLNGKAAS